MMVTSKPTELDSIDQLFVVAQTAGLRSLVFREPAMIRRVTGDEPGSVNLLVEPHSLAAFADLLSTNGYCRTGYGKTGNADLAQRFLSYNHRSEALLQLNLYTEFTVGNRAGNHFTVKGTERLFNSIETLEADQCKNAITVVTSICEAAMLPGYRVRSKRLLMECAKATTCCASVLENVADSIVGKEAGRFVVKLSEALDNWEVDLLMGELGRLLKKVEEVDYRPASFFPRLKHRERNTARRLTDSGTQYRRAPIVVITDSEPDHSHALQLVELFGSGLECQMVEFESLTPGGTGLAQSPATADAASSSVEITLSALRHAFTNYRKFRRMNALASKGVLVFVTGFPVLVEEDSQLPLLKQWLSTRNCLWRDLARAEQWVYRKISASVIDCHLIVEPSEVAGSTGEVNPFEKRRLSQALHKLPVTARNKEIIPADLSHSAALQKMVLQTMRAISAP